MGTRSERGTKDRAAAGAADGQKERARDLKSWLTYLKAERAKRESDWKDAQELVASSVYNWSDSREKLPRRPRRFTSRPTHNAKTLVNGITAYSISPSIVWMKLGLEDSEQLKMYGVRDWLEKVEAIYYAEYRRSNLYPQVAKLIEHAVIYGHGDMLIDERVKDSRLRFTTIKPTEIYQDIDEFDEVDTVFRVFTMTLKAMVDFFGLENLPPRRREEYKRMEREGKTSAAREQEVDIIHAVYPREVSADRHAGGKLGKPWASVYLDDGEEWIIEESGYNEFPYAVFIWDPIPGTAYGESPAIHALDDIRLLGKTEESRLRVAQLAGNPMLNVPDEEKEFSVIPGEFYYYSDSSKIVKPIDTGANFPITIEITQAIEDRVKDWFSVDYFIALQHEAGVSKQMTATEVMALQGEKAAVLADMVVRLNYALQKIVERTFNILWQQRKIPAPPTNLMGSGARMKVELVGPLAQTLKRYHETLGIAEGLQIAGAVAKLFPESLDVIDGDEMLKRGLENAGVSQFVIREEKDVKATRQARAQAQAQAAQQAAAAQQAQALMSNADKLNQPVQSGSMLSQLDQAMGMGGGETT